MNYRVVCRANVAFSLNARAFLDLERSVQTAKVVDATELVFDRLSVDQVNAGESRHGEERVIVVDPISIVYEVFPETETVLIYSMKHRHYRAV
jgi:hypothetical protein